jgi:hypothetical protein
VNVIIDVPVLVSVVLPRAGMPTWTVPKLIVVGENFSVELGQNFQEQSAVKASWLLQKRFTSKHQ